MWVHCSCEAACSGLLPAEATKCCSCAVLCCNSLAKDERPSGFTRRGAAKVGRGPLQWRLSGYCTVSPRCCAVGRRREAVPAEAPAGDALGTQAPRASPAAGARRRGGRDCQGWALRSKWAAVLVPCQQQPSGTAKLQKSLALHTWSFRTIVSTRAGRRCPRLCSTWPRHLLCSFLIKCSLKQCRMVSKVRQAACVAIQAPSKQHFGTRGGQDLSHIVPQA